MKFVLRQLFQRINSVSRWPPPIPLRVAQRYNGVHRQRALIPRRPIHWHWQQQQHTLINSFGLTFARLKALSRRLTSKTQTFPLSYSQFGASLADTHTERWNRHHTTQEYRRANFKQNMRTCRKQTRKSNEINKNETNRIFAGLGPGSLHCSRTMFRNSIWDVLCLYHFCHDLKQQ